MTSSILARISSELRKLSLDKIGIKKLEDGITLGDGTECLPAKVKTFTEKPNLSMFPSEQVKLGFEMEPWNLKDYKLIWSSTNESILLDLLNCFLLVLNVSLSIEFQVSMNVSIDPIVAKQADKLLNTNPSSILCC